MNNIVMIEIQLNGKIHHLQKSLNVSQLLNSLMINKKKVAIEINGEVLSKDNYDSYRIKQNDVIEIVTFIGGIMSDKLKISKYSFNSRLIVGTGKYKDLEETAAAVKASKAEIVTVAVRRVNILKKDEPILMDYIDPKKIMYLPNTAGCYTSEDALRVLRLARESGGWNLVKLEVLGDEKTLYPNMQETLRTAKILVKENLKLWFIVLMILSLANNLKI